MSTLDVDTQRIVDRLADVQERQAELAGLELELKTELRDRLQVGVRYADSNGVPRVALQPNRRFNPTLAEQVLDPTIRARCLVVTLDPKRVKAEVSSAMYEQCMTQYDPKVVLL